MSLALFIAASITAGVGCVLITIGSLILRDFHPQERASLIVLIPAGVFAIPGLLLLLVAWKVLNP